MKKTFLILPLAFLLAQCSTSKNTAGTAATGTTSATTASTTNTGMNSATGDVNATSTTSTTMDANTATGTTATNSNSIINTSAPLQATAPASVGTAGEQNWKYHNGTADIANGNVYNGYNDPYSIRAADLTTTGGWTNNLDWRRNINYNQALDGSWQLQMTPEVATAWQADRSQPQTYGSYWTPEAIRSRQQTYMSASATMDTRTKGKTKKTAKKSANASAGTSANASMNMNNSTINMNGTATASTNTDMNATMTGNTNMNGSMNTTANAGMNDATMTTNGSMDAGTNNNMTGMYTAVNGNNFMMPRLRLFIENGSFTGYTGCNNISGMVTVNGDRLHFENPTPLTHIDCAGGFDQSAFIDRLRRVDSYDMLNDQLRLKQGDEVLMVLAKNANQ